MKQKLTASDVTVVTVSYNSSTVLPAMLSSLPDETAVVIVDNAGNDAEQLSALASKHNANLITNATNRGFGVACNIGAKEATTPLLLFLNPDAALSDGCLDALLEAFDTYPRAGAFVPNVRDGKGRPAFRRRSRLLARQDWWSGPPPTQDTEVPMLNGAAVFVTRDSFDFVDGFDEAIFLFHEDDDLSMRIAASCGPLQFVHGAVVNHSEGDSTVRSPAVAAFIAHHMAQSAIYTMRKHNRPNAFIRVFIHALMQMVSPLNLLSKRKRAKHLGFIQGALNFAATEPKIPGNR